MKELNAKCFIGNDTEGGGLMRDNVAIVLEPLIKGEKVSINNYEFYTDDSAEIGDTVAIKNLEKGDRLISLGVAFGIVKEKVIAGTLIRAKGNKNFRSLLPEEDIISITKAFPKPPEVPKEDKYFFDGYVRKDSSEIVGVGVKNYVLVINTVKCSATATKNISHLMKKLYLEKFPNVDDIKCITHDFGCGIPPGDPTDELIRLIIQAIKNPNIGSVVLIGLGCERLTVDENSSANILGLLSEKVPGFDKKVCYAHLQQFSSEIEAVKEIASKQGFEALELANTFERSPQPLKYLTLGLKCGGSDRFSGVAANLVLGALSNLIIENGGKVILTESNELEGAIELLACRAINTNIRKWLLNLIPRFNRASQKYPIPGSGHQVEIAPGNKDGGLHNIRLKSIGSYRKAGSKPVSGILEYGDELSINCIPGVYILDSPSYDQISTSALFLSGAQVVAFTTGRGTTIGSSLGPVLKIGNRKGIGLIKHMDFIAEKVFDRKSPRKISEEMLIELLDRMSGRKTFAVENINQEYLSQGFPGIHDEFMFWKRWPDN